MIFGILIIIITALILQYVNSKIEELNCSTMCVKCVRIFDFYKIVKVFRS